MSSRRHTDLGRPAIADRERLLQAVAGFRASRIILSAFELGIFSALGDRRLEAGRVARLTGIDPRAGERLLNALCALGLVRKAGGRYANSGISRRYLVAGRPGYLAGLSHSASQWQSWSTLSAAVRRGTAVRQRPAASGGEARRRGFIAAMHDRASRQAPVIVARLDLKNVKRGLDIGAGSGAYAMALARAGKNMRVTAFDLPEVLPITREYVRREGFTRRIDFRPGDFRRGGFGRGYDLVMLSAVVHMNDGPQNRRLIARAAAALALGGQLVVQDFIMDAGRTRPALGALFALNMLVATAGGDSYTAAEIASWMRGAGLKDIRRIPTPFPASLLVGRKPGAACGG
ncbi:MAG: methyltransferase domain-containing protein [Candidatus Aminicenantes bacterium]|nr:methyltransferase domain-containing protein [Candidatus Aminicenantes bacterium]